MQLGVARILNRGLGILVSKDIIPKQSVFAELLLPPKSDNWLKKRMNGLTPIGLEDFWQISSAIKRLDPDTYRWVIQQVFMDPEL